MVHYCISLLLNTPSTNSRLYCTFRAFRCYVFRAGPHLFNRVNIHILFLIVDIKVWSTRKIEDSLSSRTFEHSGSGAHFSLHLETFDHVVREREREKDDNVFSFFFSRFFFRVGPHFLQKLTHTSWIL